MIRRPPRSTPFPTRRSSDLAEGVYTIVGTEQAYDYGPYTSWDQTAQGTGQVDIILSNSSGVTRTILTAEQIELLITSIVTIYAQPDSDTALTTYQALVLANPLADHFQQLSPFAINPGYLHLKAYQSIITASKDRLFATFNENNKVGTIRTIARYGTKTAPAYLNQNFSDWEHIDVIPRNRLNMTVSTDTSSGFVL